MTAGFAVAIAVAGCGDYSTTIHGQDYNYEPNPVAATRTVHSAPPDVVPDTNDPLLADGDPLTRPGDPLTNDSRGVPPDPLAGRGDPVAGGSPLHGWYWIDGSIEGGRIGIFVNGKSIGQYSVRVDKEITWLCHPGENTLTFVHFPAHGQGVCNVYLNVVNKRPPGHNTILTYDSSQDAYSVNQAGNGAQPYSETTPAIPDGRSDQTPTAGTDAQGSTNSAQANAGAAPPMSDGHTKQMAMTPTSAPAPVSETRTFFDE